MSRDWWAADPNYRPPQRTPEEELQWSAWHAWNDKAWRNMTTLGQEHEWPSRYEPENNWWRPTMPKKRLLCPAGHRLVTVETSDTYGKLMPVREPYGGRPESGHVVVLSAEMPAPGQSDRRLTTCGDTGCLTQTAGVRCEQHATSPADLLDREEGCVRWQFRCPNKRCRYDGRWTGARLFMVYVVACYLDVPEVRLPS